VKTLDGAPAIDFADPLVRFTGVCKSYDGHTLVVNDLNLDVARGEFLTLLGPSGSGKTTTLMMLAGFEVPTRGRILINGRDVTTVPPHRRGIGVVFQNYALFPHMTIGENVAYPLAARGTQKAEIVHRVTAALEMMKLGGFGNRRPAQLSGGQQQRVALARALVFEPDLILLDEPLGALDKQLRDRMQQELKQLHKTLGVTMVYVTHDQEEALTMSDRIAVFSEGQIQQIGSPSDIYERPANPFVAGFVGENNLLPGTIAAVDGTIATIAFSGNLRLRAGMLRPMAVGEPVLLSIRPELIALDAAVDNGSAARIERITYLGEGSRLALVTESGIEFIVKTGSRQARSRLHQGAKITFGFAAEDACAFERRG
jgi:putative spermidine/putrescine transport system ATP-binding protein